MEKKNSSKADGKEGRCIQPFVSLEIQIFKANESMSPDYVRLHLEKFLLLFSFPLMDLSHHFVSEIISAVL